MVELSKQLPGEKIVVSGYRGGDLFLKDELSRHAELVVATEDGSAGTRGNVLDAIRENDLHADAIFACGPGPMLRALKAYAEEEGIEFKVLNNPVRILGYENKDNPRDPKTGFVRAVECVRMELGEPDEKGRRRPVEVPGSEYVMDADCVIMALGTSPNPLIKNTTKGLETQKWGGIIVNEDTGLTSREGVYAGGDAVTGAATVILAMGAGKTAAKAIDEYLSAK